MPDEGFGVLVPVLGPLVDGVGEFGYGSVGAPAYLFGGEFGEPSLDEVAPRRVGGCEMEREPWMALQPAPYGLCFVGRRVVQHDMDVEFWWDFAVDEV